MSTNRPSCCHLALIIFCLISLPIQAKKLSLDPGTMSVGGSAQIRYSTPDINGAWSWNFFKLGVDLNYSYFLLKDFAIIGDVALKGRIAKGFDEERLYRFGAGVFYAFDLGSDLFPYVQLVNYAAWAESGWSIGVVPQFGLLLAIAPQIALDFGLSAQLDFPVPKGGNTTFDAGTGYFGLRGFF